MDKVTIGNCDLYLGDSLEILPQLGQFADCIVSDPPYKLTKGGKNTSKLGGIFAAKNYNNNGSIIGADISWKNICKIYYDALKPNSDCYMFSNDKNLGEMLLEAKVNKFKLHNMLIWHKRNKMANRWYMKNAEFIGYFYKGKARYINNMSHAQVWNEAYKKATKHPTEKPIELCKHYVMNSTDEGGIVLDAFMGVGTTGLACIDSNRRFVGIEKDEKWFNIAVERLKDAQNKN